ncbi:hypothetical protein TcG_08985 [Trypanosoma cruzi]|nr:hypothetical protein TcBrA4_0034400 [Trypanosoma cruzi]RNF11644.1 hypothetical protein TcG_08985 [Trypanosoma cruzi]
MAPPSSSACDPRAYLHERVRQHYLEVLPSRWRAVLFRLAKNTQLRQKNDVIAETHLLSEIQADFDLIHALLDEEHRVYREGVACLCSQALNGKSETERWTASRHLLQGMLSCIAMKEILIAHWKNDLVDISPNTLRVYCHACISHPHVSETDIERLLALYAVS